ncbi:hypothetical protein ACA910_007704 [Epithemia clementina (nom. ined.)]
MSSSNGSNGPTVQDRIQADGGLNHQSDGSTNGEPTTSLIKSKEEEEEEDQSTRSSSVDPNKFASNIRNPGRSMADRSKIPASFMVSLVSVAGLQLFSGSWDRTTLESVSDSYQTAVDHLQKLVIYFNKLSQSVFLDAHARPPLSEYLVASLVTLAVAWVTYVLFLAPLMGGFWTGARANRHMLHRYMGLVYLIQYPLAWIEFARNYESAKDSYLPHLIALNGIIQAWSAFFSFKVLPELNDAGYYSDKSVLSRSFVHENAFFQLMTVFGSLYYIDGCRAALRASWPGRVLEYVYMFWPYVLVRPLFPITRFKDAGSTHKGRSANYQKFYEIATYLVKIFYLYAKYFLGFYFNFLIFLDLPTENDWRLLRGCLLLNIGTVSIAMFLHTLRFKKIFPGVMTFSIYLGQIYATILGIPFVYDIFASHPKLMALCLAGLLCNMTRSRKIHAVWCFAAMCLTSYKGIEW